jgi:hypothetical protein
MGRERGIGHNDMKPITVMNSLHARVLVAENIGSICTREHVSELVMNPIVGGEHQDVGDVVKETRSWSVVTTVTFSNSACEEMILTLMMEKSSVEDSAVTRY